MSYIDGFVIPVPAAQEDAYRRLAAMMASILVEHGALHVVETWEDDIKDGTHTDFRTAVKAEAGEKIVFSWIVWPSREVRDAGNAKFMADPRITGDENPMPFDGKRLIMGGFRTIVEERA
ncbi:DUF1428 domain-containing protein [Sandaracinobacteroides saxicola]|uniref:DUF1428 domain-containing protein n=1 Tax=Sandaracinobacteroides saxicola TaxID=2759707 RepID=A0A7G5IG42_9SPHN|nr:DUF1428 domain-containing protein [Sandaracinobacteroides saxicola]QMW22334.1 DUF1428 domain-containing protein [Sandaracinobacteroides saxicola]